MGDGNGRPKGPLGIDPLHFSVAAFGLLLLFVLYLLLPRAMRKQYFGAYPKRHAWSARTRARRNNSNNNNNVNAGSVAPNGTRSYAQAIQGWLKQIREKINEVLAKILE